MSLFEIIIQKGAQFGASASQVGQTPSGLQNRQLLWLLQESHHTLFGQHYGFKEIALAPDVGEAFRRQVPAFDYNRLYEAWWSQSHLADTPDVCWPGVVPYYAVSSGTSQAATKYIPVTDDMLRVMKRGSRRMFLDIIGQSGLPLRQFAKKLLMVGSCTAPMKEGRHFTGDLSGIAGLNRPGWMEMYARPGRHISDLPEWGQRIEKIAEEAHLWDIGFVVGNPMWVQLIFERIIQRYGLKNIHEIWKNFNLLIHGGVFFEPYRASFEQLLDHPVVTFDSYMASEGFFSYQTSPHHRSMRLLTDCGIYFEFVPFDDENFDENGDLRSEFPQALRISEVKEGRNYAFLISTCAGAWRYLLGDTIQFTDVERMEIRLTGRTKQFLSVCGEHLSIDNLNAAVAAVDQQLHAGIREFTVMGLREGSYWAHQWYLSCENPLIQAEQFVQLVDRELCRLNDDYAVERRYPLHDVRAQILPNEIFMGWLQHRGKMNGQAKVPRVLKGKQMDDFNGYLAENGVQAGS